MKNIIFFKIRRDLETRISKNKANFYIDVFNFIIKHPKSSGILQLTKCKICGKELRSSLINLDLSNKKNIVVVEFNTIIVHYLKHRVFFKGISDYKLKNLVSILKKSSF